MAIYEWTQETRGGGGGVGNWEQHMVEKTNSNTIVRQALVQGI